MSAHSPDALHRNATALANALDDGCNDVDVAALCYTSNKVKSSLKHRFAAAGTRNELIGALLGYDMSAPTENRRVAVAAGCGSVCCAPDRVPSTPG